MKTFRIVCLILVVVFLVVSWWQRSNTNRGPTEVPVPQTQVSLAPSQTGQVTSEVTPTPIFTPTPVEGPRTVDGFVLKDLIDLGSGKATALTIILPGGELQLPSSTWAKAVSAETAEPEAFDPHKGTIFSLKSGSALVVLVHSGVINYNPDTLFGANIDRFLTHEATPKKGLLSFLTGARKFTLEEGYAKLSELNGTTAYLCQTDPETDPYIVPLIVFTGKCRGQIIELKIRATALIPREKVEQYDWTIPNGEILPWLQNSYPWSGFDLVSDGNGFLLSTCVQQFADQPDIEGVDYFVYNRVGIWFEIQ